MPFRSPIEPVVLEGAHVRLEPLARSHFEGLYRVGLDPDLWRWTQARVESREDLKRYLETALRERAEGVSVPFATIDRASVRPAGSTRFSTIRPESRGVEIGWTWLGRAHQRTALNTEAKLLMMRHAFETWGCLRVELKTDVLNEKSRNAMRRIGCVEEGVLRAHVITESGRVRDTIYYSVLESEWPGVKARLEALLARGASPATRT
jgi:RimJ/RimL family protein N-acetyltransferase